MTKCWGSLLMLASDNTLLMVLMLMSVPVSRVSLMDSSSLEVLQMLSSTNTSQVPTSRLITTESSLMSYFSC